MILQRLLASVHDYHLLGAMWKMWCLKAEVQGAVPGLTPECAKRRLRLPHLVLIVQGIPKKENIFHLIKLLMGHKILSLFIDFTLILLIQLASIKKELKMKVRIEQ